jgi:hypothetical protein
MGLKNLLMRKMLQSKMKDVPPEQQEKIFAMIEKNPEFFQKIGVEVQEKIKQGKDQMSATMEVMSKYQDDLKGMM